MATVNEDQYTFMIISSTFLPKMRNVSDKNCRENQDTFFIFKKPFFFFGKSCHLWDNVEKQRRARQATGDNMMCAHWMLDN